MPTGVSVGQKVGRSARLRVSSTRRGPLPRPSRGTGWGPGGPSGRPGNRGLRIDLKPLSTERPGPTRVAPAGRARNVPSPWCERWAWLPVAARRRRTSPDPAGSGGLSDVSRPDVTVVDPAEPTGPRRLAVNTRSCCGFPIAPQVSGEKTQVAPHRAGRGRHPGAHGDHSPSRTNTVRPPTTVRRQSGRSRPGVRSGRPGVPERGSVDQRATRSSGAWTTSSSVRQTA